MGCKTTEFIISGDTLKAKKKIKLSQNVTMLLDASSGQNKHEVSYFPLYDIYRTVHTKILDCRQTTCAVQTPVNIGYPL
jgi:hypothetical protein